MKKIMLILSLMLSVYSLNFAQTVDDALRYSQIFYSGSSRFTSMGGAFTALGGDLSTLSQNPAGIGVFRSSEITMTPQLFHINTRASFKYDSSDDYLYDFNLAQAGFVMNLIRNNSETGLINLNLGYSFNKTNNFNQTAIINGVGDRSSLADYWAEYNNGYTVDEMSSDAYLGWTGYVIDSISGYNDQWGTVFSGYGEETSVYGQTITRYVDYSGSTGEHAISIGGNYSNKLFFGAALGISRLRFTSHYEHLETTDEELPSRYSDLSGFSDFRYTFDYDNTGTGFTFKLGTIYKPIEALRIGFAFHSPTIFRIHEEAYDNLTAHFDEGGLQEASNNILGFDYALTTPFRVMIGAAIQIKKLALVSAEYEFADYRAARFSTVGNDSYDYSLKNQQIKNSLKSSNNLRLGAELRLNKIYLRGGYSLYGRALQSEDINRELQYNSLSCGIGFREQNINIDLGYTNIYNPLNYILYDTYSETAISDMWVSRNIFSVTFGYKFGY
ncbi:MAG TPA: hypothetical protein PLR52_01875 [Bacteroidales bacterium]|nr:hypothetical protein [Bacteroidales bacterium]HPI68612.1 hypothetical protein [Bacteroidales bacterium]HPR73157.1 hypothetical protein [Bacteroidales bacterium]